MPIDHRSAAGDFGSLVSLRKQHFIASSDGDVTPVEAETYRNRVNEFKANCVGPGVRVAIFGKIASGAFVTAEQATFLVEERSIGFDWTEAQRLLHQAESIADQAAEWWPCEAATEPESTRARKRREAKNLERRPHVDRAFDLMGAVLSAVNEENRRVSEHGSTSSEKDNRSDNFMASMKVIEQDIRRAQGLLDKAAQRHAQLTYTTGMLVGVGALAIACALLGASFYLTDTPAANGVALLAGGLGAVVSVLQQMTSGALHLDETAGSSMLFRFGALRPVVGGILGLAVATLFAGGLLPAISVEPGQELPFYAAIGFLAGFSERFAQDMIANSGRPLAPTPDQN